MIRGLVTLATALALSMGANALAAPRTAVAEEYQVKAAFLVNFMKFVEWPPDGPARPAGIVVIEPDPFGLVLDEYTRNAGPSPGLSVIRRAPESPVPPCRMLFVGARAGAPGLRTLATAEPGALTVGETQEFLARGGIIRLNVVDGHVRVEINIDAARRSGLRISSKLLRIATTRHEEDLR